MKIKPCLKVTTKTGCRVRARLVFSVLFSKTLKIVQVRDGLKKTNPAKLGTLSQQAGGSRGGKVGGA